MGVLARLRPRPPETAEPSYYNLSAHLCYNSSIYSVFCKGAPSL